MFRIFAPQVYVDVVGGRSSCSPEMSQKMVNACTSRHRAAVIRVMLLLLAALAMASRNTVAASFDVGSVDHVGSFSELELSVGSGARAIEITAPKVMFDHQLEVRHTGTPLHIASGIGATLWRRTSDATFLSPQW